MNDAHEYRVCPRCDRELPLTEEWWHPSRIKALIEYEQAPWPRWCKKCSLEYGREYDKEYRKQLKVKVYQHEYGLMYQSDYRRRNRKHLNIKQILSYHRKRGNTDRVAELEAELEALKTAKEQNNE